MVSRNAPKEDTPQISTSVSGRCQVDDPVHDLREDGPSEQRSERSFGRSAVLYGAAVGAKVIAGIVVVKLIALVADPAALGQIGQLMSLLAVVGMVAGGGIFNGVVAKLAPLRYQSVRWYSYVKAALLIWFGSSFAIGVTLIAFARPLSRLALGNESGAPVIWLLASTQVLLGLNNLLQAVLSSQKQVVAYSASNVLGTVAGLAFFVALWRLFGFDGVVYGLVAMPCFAVLFSAWFTRSRHVLRMRELALSYQQAEVGTLLKYSISGLVAAVLIPLSQLIVREIVARRVGWEPVGYWQASLKVSEVHLQFFGVVLVNFVLPSLAAARGRRELAAKVRSTYRNLLPVFLVGAAAIFLLRDQIVRWVLAPKYAPMTEYLGPQLAGDFLKLIGVVPGYLFLAQGKVRLYLASECLQAVLYVGSVMVTASVFLEFAPVYGYGIAQGFFLIWVLPLLRAQIASEREVTQSADSP